MIIPTFDLPRRVPISELEDTLKEVGKDMGFNPKIEDFYREEYSLEAGREKILIEKILMQRWIFLGKISPIKIGYSCRYEDKTNWIWVYKGFFRREATVKKYLEQVYEKLNSKPEEHG